MDLKKKCFKTIYRLPVNIVNIRLSNLAVNTIICLQNYELCKQGLHLELVTDCRDLYVKSTSNTFNANLTKI